ncbi:MAG: hypothetical protein Q9166_005510 [cf. Caloplaca sp. 2 TL-2023]
MSPSFTTQSNGGAEHDLVTDEVTYKDKSYNIIREGLADILNLKSTAPARNGSTKPSVFYNPIQQFNRDLSVLAIRVFAEDLAIIRRARHEKRLQQLAKGGQKGTKRKRQDEPGAGKSRNWNTSKRTEGPEGTQNTEVSATAQNAESVEQPQSEEGTSFNGSGAALASSQNIGNADALVEIKSQSVGHPEEPRIDQGVPQPKTQSSVHVEQQNGTPKNTTPPFRILDALSATGLRALRYVKEIPHVTMVTANDLSPSAAASIKLNAEYNGIAGKVQPTTGDAKALMYHHIAHKKEELFHVIDLDPYGTAVPFLDAAVQAVSDGGLLCVTCTDAGVFAAVGWPEKAFSQYGGVSWKGTQNHEAGLRLILNAVATSAARYSLAIEPLLSLNIDFYARLFIRIHKSPSDVKFFASKSMVVYNCDHGCGSFSIQYLAQSRKREAKNGDKFYTHSLAQAPSATPFCEQCGFKTHLAGPMWGGPLHNPHFITKIVDVLPSLDSKVYGTIPRIEGMLTLALNETLFQEPFKMFPRDPAETNAISPLDPALRDPHPFFFNPSFLARTLHCSVPSEAALRGALVGLGYRTTRSHTEPGSIRTDAPWSVIWEIMREWVRQKHPIKEGALKRGMAGYQIMRNDRARRSLEDAKAEVRKVLDDAEDVEGLRTRIEAALYRLCKASTEANDSKEQNGTAQEEEGREGRQELKVVFDEKLGKEAAGKKMVRYQMNPRPDWGPMSKAKGEHC